MTDANPTLNADDIVDDLETETARLDRAADQWIDRAEAKSFARDRGVRQALRTDIETGRDWAKDRAAQAKSQIEEEPLKATLYALGVGVLIGILLRR